ncbi:MAG: ATP-dependent DNA helicase RecG [Gammaproteobacteria bacterium]|nr:ATP-dependent DNA helicase RecG [Gammaproteobacteria bacterium]
MHCLSEKPLTDLKGIGAKVAEKFTKLNIANCLDLLFHLPSGYEDRTKITEIISARAGQKLLFEATVAKSHIAFRRSGRNRRMLVLNVHDETGQMTLRFFHFSATQQKQLSEGVTIRFFGEVSFLHSIPEIAHPEYQLITVESPVPLETTLTPIYPVTEGVHQRTIRNAMVQVLEIVQQQAINETLPDAWLCRQQLPELTQSLIALHSPKDLMQSELIQAVKHPAQTRLIIEELAVHQVVLRQKKKQLSTLKSPIFKVESFEFDQFEALFPFVLTSAQKRVCLEVLSDIKSQGNMMRLLQGDVGSGKTVIAAYASIMMIKNGYQSVLMAPTEILAEQHLQNFSTWFKGLGVNIVFLSGADKGKTRKQKEQMIEQGDADMIIGTHALFHTKVGFKNPGMVVIDEQHRFGVEQRKKLMEKGLNELTPHTLIMTATPIPRTLAMSVYADLDYSQIDELPPGRTAIKTSVVSEAKRGELIDSVRNACSENKQVYWVCTLIEESEVLQCQTAEDTYQILSGQLAPYKVGLIHGRMKAEEKEAIIQSFKQKKIQVLVATTVIEVGVDVPNASIMVIENSERLGLSQIHQLRGRVGRGSIESYCILLVSDKLSHIARARLQILRESTDGFRIAEKDLEIRGAGELLGTRQSGGVQMKIADISRDFHLLTAAQNLAELLQQEEHQHLQSALINHWLGAKQNFVGTG